MTAISLLTGRGFDTSLHYYAGAIDHFSSCQCVDGGCSAPNNAFSNQPNRSAGNHCFQNIAANQTPVRDCRFSGEVCGDGPEGDGPATLVRMEGQGKLCGRYHRIKCDCRKVLHVERSVCGITWR